MGEALTAVQVFRDDDAGYLAWVQQHPDGFGVPPISRRVGYLASVGEAGVPEARLV
jgi:hypothetical protein